MSRTLDRSQGKFEAMPVSDGAPIVESGSNADGEWTRWADGTQIVFGALPDVGVAVGSVASVTGTYPITFLVGTLPARTATGTPNPSSDFYGVVYFNYASGTKETVISPVFRNGSQTTQTITFITYTATGRWK